MPLTATTGAGGHYAGVRYRAWQPWSALHPSIEVHAPLRFDVVDTASAASLGGATYHVVHPGGRSYDHPPVNAHEAEARRLGRFEPLGHTAGRLDVAAIVEAGRRAASRGLPAHPRPAARASGRRSGELRVTVLRDYAAALTQPALGDLAPLRRGGRPRRLAAPGVEGAGRGRGRAHRRRPAPGRRRHRALPRRRRRHLRAARPRPRPVAARPGAAGHRRRRVGAARGRAGPARRAAQRDPRRPVRRAAAAVRRHPAAGRGLRPRRLHPGGRPPLGHRPAAAGAGRDRPRPRRRRRVAGARRPRPGAVRHRLRDGEPAGHLAGAARALPRGRAAPDGAVLLGAALGAAPVRPGRPGRPAGRRAVAGHPLGDGVRPGVRRLRARLPARAGQRPRGPRRLGLPAGAGPAGARRRDPAPRRRRVERPAGAARRLPARRRRPGRGRTPRPGPHRQRARRRRAREPRPAALPARGLRGAARRAAAARLGADLVVRRPRRASSTCSTGSTALRSSARSTAGPRTSPTCRPTSCATRILAAPHRFVGQERLPLSQSPTWSRGGARPAPVTLRTFTLRYGSAYRPLVGGLASVWLDATSPDQQGRLGAQGQRRRPRPGPVRRAADDRARSVPCWCRASSRTCSGSAATPSAPRTCCGWCSPRTRSPRTSAPGRAPPAARASRC